MEGSTAHRKLEAHGLFPSVASEGAVLAYARGVRRRAVVPRFCCLSVSECSNYSPSYQVGKHFFYFSASTLTL